MNTCDLEKLTAFNKRREQIALQILCSIFTKYGLDPNGSKEPEAIAICIILADEFIKQIDRH